MYKGKKLKTSEKPKTFIPGEQLDKLNINSGGQSANFDQQQRNNIMNQRVQPTKEDIEAIKVNVINILSFEIIK